MNEERYAIVEIMGHRRHVGRVSEVEEFGAKMLRVDVPEGGSFNTYTTHLYAPASIFGITFTDLETVLSIARREAPTTGLYLPRPASHGLEIPASGYRAEPVHELDPDHGDLFTPAPAEPAPEADPFPTMTGSGSNDLAAIREWLERNEIKHAHIERQGTADPDSRARYHPGVDGPPPEPEPKPAADLPDCDCPSLSECKRDRGELPANVNCMMPF